MILFSCEECKVAYQVEEEYAGGTMDCGSCGVGISIPKTSDKKVILVYKAGESEDGVAMLQEEVERMLVSGELSDTDLAWDGETWRPLPAYLELLEDGDEKPKLSLKKQDGYVPPQPDDEFGDIEPIQKIGGAGKEGKKRDKKKTKADKKKAKAEAKKSKAEKKGKKKKKEDAGEEHDGDGVL
ncbi:MAG: hypothetical protein KAI66_03075, partial [Lentisphaeria bacterium]|nr:hypothetical protein [Lentisphaeria bacterium]